MLFLVKKEDVCFYTNPEDAMKYYEEGYEIINEETGHILTEEEVKELKAEVIIIPIMNI